MYTTPSVYLAGPISGLTYEEARYGWRQDITGMIHGDISVLSPMRQEGHLKELGTKISKQADYDDHPVTTGRAIVAKDHFDIEQCSLVIFNFLDSISVSQGSLVELGWANAKRKPIILIMEEKGNEHDTLFVTELADFRVDNIEEAAQIVNGLLLPGV